MSFDLIFEIGTEEIPAGFLARGLSALEDRAKAKLEAARMVPASLRVLGTPRRMALCVGGIPERQPDLFEEVVGPPAQAAFDKQGKPTQAAIGFAKKNGADPAALRRGEIVAFQLDRTMGGRGDGTVPFFGAPARFPLGPFVIAAAAGAPVVPAFCVLERDGRYRLHVEPALTVSSGAEAAALAAAVAVLERYVARHWDQWFNFYDVWECAA